MAARAAISLVWLDGMYIDLNMKLEKVLPELYLAICNDECTHSMCKCTAADAHDARA